MKGSGQRAHSQVSGGQNIDDHSFWAGSGNEQNVLPMGAKFKSESGAEGAGSLSKYEDTAAAIKAQQEEGVRKIKSHPMKPGYRE